MVGKKGMEREREKKKGSVSKKKKGRVSKKNRKRKKRKFIMIHINESTA